MTYALGQPAYKFLIRSPDQDKMSITKALRKAAIGARSTLGHGYLLAPSGVGFSALYKFIGNRTISTVLSIAGPQATLEDLIIITRNLKTFVQAADENPNAVTMWFSMRHNGEKTDTSPETPWDIIGQAEYRFLQKASLPYNGPPRNPLLLWETAQHLNHAAISQCLLNPENLITLANLVHDAERQPSCTALKTLTRASYYIDYPMFHPALTRSFIRESKALTHRRNHTRTQKALAEEYTLFATIKPDEIKHDAQNTIRQIAAAIPKDADLTWDEVSARFPTELISAAEKPSRKARSRASTKPPETKPRSLTEEQLEQILRNCPGDVMEQALADAVTIDVVPGKRVSLNAAGDTEPVLAVEKEADETISIKSHNYFVPGDLPGPDQSNPSPWTTRGLKNSVATRCIHDYLKQNWQHLAPGPRIPVPSQERISYHLNTRLQEASVKDTRYTTDQQLSTALWQGIASLLDPKVHDTARNLSSKVDIYTYNIVAAAHTVLQDLLRTNPGALTWAMETRALRGPPQHPGEVVSAAKSALFEAGLDPVNWRFVATLDPAVMRTLATDEHETLPLSNRIFILNIIAETRTVPDRDVLESALHQTKRLLEQGHTTLNQANTRTFAKLLLRADRPPRAEETFSVTDYVASANEHDIIIESTTWTGLKKATNRWHRQLREQYIEQEWKDLLQRQEGLYKAWNTALGEHRDGDHTVTPLSTEYDLYQESLRMAHCVINYGSTCAKGSSRIFSIHEDGKRVATTQIQNIHGTWAPVQTRGYRNSDVDESIHELARRVAHRYQQAWNPEKAQHAWPVDHLT